MNTPSLLGNRYQLIEPLGTGGMAEVHRARDLMLERYVAVKILRSDYASNADFQERFRQEAKAAANLSHPNIVTVHDFGFDQGLLYIVMEFVPGKTLKELIQMRGHFTPEEAIPLMVQASAGIGYAHRAGLVHCDVKPHNMLVTPDMRLKVTDFGIARALSSIQPEEKTEIVWGSPLYFSPEQASGHAPTPASDVYSLGIVLYEMLTGQPPFNARSAEALAEMHRDVLPRPPSYVNPAISPALEQIILKTLAKEPSARYRTADQLGRVLMNFGNAQSAPALQLTPEIPSSTQSQHTPTVATSWPTTLPMVEQNDLNIDWVAVGLGLLAFIAVLGLLPFWMYVFGLYR
jgi:serine/threonine protein kinase